MGNGNIEPMGIGNRNGEWEWAIGMGMKNGNWE